MSKVHPADSNKSSKAGQYGEYVPRDKLDDATLAEAKRRGLRLGKDNTEEGIDAVEYSRQVEIIRTMPVNIYVKRDLRDMFKESTPDFHGSKCRECRYNCNVGHMKRARACKLKCMEIDSTITLWNKSLKKVEGHYGSGVLTYFVFLKWLLQLNIVIFSAIFLWIILPEAALTDRDEYQDNTLSQRARTCSKLYTINDTHDWYEHILDFFQGTGFMEKSIVFYGHYKGTDLNSLVVDYNLRLAYILVFGFCFIVSLAFMVHNTAKSFRERVFMSNNEYRQFANKAFGGWDYTLFDEKSAVNMHKSLFTEFRSLLENEKDRLRRENRSDKEWCRIVTLRIIAWFIVGGVLAGSAYLIYYVTKVQAELTTDEKYEDKHVLLQLLIEYMTTLTIAVLSAVVPILFKQLSKFEDYQPSWVTNLDLGRTILMKMASLAVLVLTLYAQVLCSKKDDVCDVGYDRCPSLRCWETYVGQEFYKLTIISLFQHLFKFIIECVRRAIVTKFDNKLTQKIGKAEFDIPMSVIDLIYLQILLWFGMFFCPLISAMAVVILIELFYLKYVSCLYNYVPPEKPYRVSQSSQFFTIVLMSAYTICVIPILYVIRKMDPSASCGPFRVYNRMYKVVPEAIDDMPNGIEHIFDFIFSASFGIPLVIVLILTVYYLAQTVYTYSAMFKSLKRQIAHEEHDKHFLLQKIAKLEGKTAYDQQTVRRRNVLKSSEPEGVKVEKSHDSARDTALPGLLKRRLSET